jgi:SAM-dependent methyltransferase
MPERIPATALDNEGERLVPGVSHDLGEAVRHRSSYLFFKAVIEADMGAGLSSNPRVLDLGCGVGHGAQLLSEIEGSDVVGVDSDGAAIAYARSRYAAAKTSYVVASIADFAGAAEPFDYVVSRHALEHVEDGLDLVLRMRFQKRMMVNVPYREMPGNPHHRINDIDEKSFDSFSNREFLYEDLSGTTGLLAGPEVNSIVCVSSVGGLPSVAELVPLPFPGWKPNLLEKVGLETFGREAGIEEKVTRRLEREYAAELERAEQQARDWKNAYEELRGRTGVRLALSLSRLFDRKGP